MSQPGPSTPEPPPLAESVRAIRERPWKLLILLMMATSIGPTSLNIIVPALPALSRNLWAEPSTLQLAVSLFLLGLAGAQLVMGPLSDRFGRRPVLIAGMSLTAAASVMAVLMSTVEFLIAARILQAVGASTGIVVGRAIIRDLFDRSRAASILGLVTTVMIAVPTFGPLIGGLLDTWLGWQAIFGFTAITSLIMATWIALALPETSRLNQIAGEPANLMRDLRLLGASRTFWGYVLIGAFASSTYFAFLGGGPHVVVTLMERSSAEYGIWFAVTSVGYMAGNFTASRLATKHGLYPLIVGGVTIEAIGACLAVVLVYAAPAAGPVIMFLPQMVIALGNGLLMPGAVSGAISVRPAAAGSAAGIMGCTQMAIGAAVAQFSGTLMAKAATPAPLALLVAGLVCALVGAFVLLGKRR